MALEDQERRAYIVATQVVRSVVTADEEARAAYRNSAEFRVWLDGQARLFALTVDLCARGAVSLGSERQALISQKMLGAGPPPTLWPQDAPQDEGAQR